MAEDPNPREHPVPSSLLHLSHLSLCLPLFVSLIAQPKFQFLSDTWSTLLPTGIISIRAGTLMSTFVSQHLMRRP